MFKQAKWLNVIFRLCIFALFVMTIVSLTSGILLVSSVIREDKDSGAEAFYNALPYIRLTFGVYYYIFILTAVCVILSVLSGSGTDGASIVFRTLCLGGCALIQFRGLPIAKVFKLFGDVTKGMSYDEMVDLSDEEFEQLLIDKGSSASEIDALFNSDASDKAILFMMLAYVVSMVVFLVLAITSVRSLYRQSQAEAQAVDMYGETQPPEGSPLRQAFYDNAIRSTAQEMRSELSDIIRLVPPEINYPQDDSHVRYMDTGSDDDDL